MIADYAVDSPRGTDFWLRTGYIQYFIGIGATCLTDLLTRSHWTWLNIKKNSSFPLNANYLIVSRLPDLSPNFWADKYRLAGPMVRNFGPSLNSVRPSMSSWSRSLNLSWSFKNHMTKWPQKVTDSCETWCNKNHINYDITSSTVLFGVNFECKCPNELMFTQNVSSCNLFTSK